MRTRLITYADKNMRTSQYVCYKSALEKGGIPAFVDYGPKDMNEWFKYFNSEIVSATQRGGGTGFWIFKPYFCTRAALDYQEGDIIIYADAGVEFIAPVQPIIDRMNAEGLDIFLFGNDHMHTLWTKGSVLDHMLPYWSDQSEQVQASAIFFRVNGYTRRFMRRWLAWSQIPGFIDDSPSVFTGKDRKGFREHRNDQSILTCLALQDDIPLHWWPVQYGHYIKHKYPNDKYPQLFYHHRYREDDWQRLNITPDQFMSQPKNI